MVADLLCTNEIYTYRMHHLIFINLIDKFAAFLFYGSFYALIQKPTINWCFKKKSPRPRPETTLSCSVSFFKNPTSSYMRIQSWVLELPCSVHMLGISASTWTYITFLTLIISLALADISPLNPSVFTKFEKTMCWASERDPNFPGLSRIRSKSKIANGWLCPSLSRVGFSISSFHHRSSSAILPYLLWETSIFFFLGLIDKTSES